MGQRKHTQPCNPGGGAEVEEETAAWRVQQQSTEFQQQAPHPAEGSVKKGWEGLLCQVRDRWQVTERAPPHRAAMRIRIHACTALRTTGPLTGCSLLLSLLIFIIAIRCPQESFPRERPRQGGETVPCKVRS